MIRTSIAAAVLLSVPSVGWATECFYAPFTMFIARQNNAHITARSGQPCTIGKYVTVRERYGLHGVKVTTRPQHGTAAAHGLVVTYRSRPGYKGRDFFTFSVHGSRHGQQKIRVEAPIHVNVSVE